MTYQEWPNESIIIPILARLWESINNIEGHIYCDSRECFWELLKELSFPPETLEGELAKNGWENIWIYGWFGECIEEK